MLIKEIKFTESNKMQLLNVVIFNLHVPFCECPPNQIVLVNNLISYYFICVYTECYYHYLQCTTSDISIADFICIDMVCYVHFK